MAHELLIENGKASMMYVGEAPWHGLGTPLKNPATAEEAIKVAKLDWQVVKRPLYAVGSGCLYNIDDKMAIVRQGKPGEPDGPVFGIVSRHYTPLQNAKAFEFFDSIVGQKAAIYHTAGALGRGERVWMLTKLPGNIRVIGDDITEKFLLLSNSHDGSSSVQVKFTPVRVVCQNTLSMALSHGRTIRVTHNRDLFNGLRQAKDLLGIVQERYAEIESHFVNMVQVKMDSLRLGAYLSRVFPTPVTNDDQSEERLAIAHERVRLNRLWGEYFFVSGKGNDAPGVKGTLWAAYNGVTELIDHRQTGMNDDRRLQSAWFGQGCQTKIRAYELATDKINDWLN